MVDPVISLAAGLVLAFVLATAAWHKLRDRPHFTATLAAYGLLPAVLVPPLAALLPVLELIIAVALPFPAWRSGAGAGAALLLGVYTLAIGINLARGRRTIDCGCGDPAQRQPLDGWLLVRNGALVVMALACAAPVLPRATGWMDWLVALFAALTVGLIYGACNQLLANRERLSTLKFMGSESLEFVTDSRDRRALKYQ